MVKFNSNEKKLIDYARKKILQYCKMRKSKGLNDIIYSFVLSDSGKIYDGASIICNLRQAGYCAERHAIGNMLLAESEKAKIVSLFVAGPVQRKSAKAITPCGICRILIDEFSTPKSTVICSEFIRNEKNWTVFPRIDKYNAKELYPHPYVAPKWD